MKTVAINSPKPYYERWPVDTPRGEREKFYIGEILLNRVRCLKCDTVIVSKHRHDFTTCPCGAVSVDGGSHYLKRVGNREDYVELSVPYADARQSGVL